MDSDDCMAKHSSHRICLCGGALDGGEPCAGLQGGRFDGLPASAPKLRRGVAGMHAEIVPSMLRSETLSASWMAAPDGKTKIGAVELEATLAFGQTVLTPCVLFSGAYERRATGLA